MARKLTYHELEQTVNELEQDLLVCKSAKAEAIKAKEELTHIFNAVPDCIAVIDRRFKILRVNKSPKSWDLLTLISVKLPIGLQHEKPCWLGF